jgi:hypothetical protein
MNDNCHASTSTPEGGDHGKEIQAGGFVPYGLWVAFATLLNASILMLN